MKYAVIAFHPHTGDGIGASYLSESIEAETPQQAVGQLFATWYAGCFSEYDSDVSGPIKANADGEVTFPDLPSTFPDEDGPVHPASGASISLEELLETCRDNSTPEYLELIGVFSGESLVPSPALKQE